MKQIRNVVGFGWFVVLLITLLHANKCFGEVGFDIYANVLRDSVGNPLPVSGLVILVASTTDSTFSTPTTNGFVSGDDVVLGKWNLSANNPGEFSISTGVILTNGFPNWNVNDPVALYWFPTLTTNSTVPVTNGTPYGFFNDPLALSYEPFLTPADGSSYFLTFDDTTYPSSQSYASFAVGNHTPVANPDSFNRTSNIALKMKISDLLTNDTDADNDSLVLTSVSISTNNVTLTSDSNYVYYPSNAPNVRDQFTYTITDGKGVFASTTVAISIVTATGTNSVVSLQVGVPGAGTNSIQFVGIPNYTYVTQYATNIAGPWLPFSTNTASTNGLWTAVDRNATNVARFYRAAY
jgi:hypothetical protein